MKSAEGVCSWRRAARERPPRDENMLVMLFCVIYREGDLQGPAPMMMIS